MSSFPLMTSFLEDLKNSNVFPEAMALSMSARQVNNLSSMGLFISLRQNCFPTSLKPSEHPAYQVLRTGVVLTILPALQIVFVGHMRHLGYSPTYKVHGLP